MSQADMNQACPKCESKRWMSDLSLVNSGETTVAVAVRPATWSAMAKGVTQMQASVCADCGYTEFYAVNPQAVWEEWSKHNR